MAEQGLKLREGTILDASIIAAPSSTKNRSGERDPEMKQTKKGKQWHFGMKLHIGVDEQTALVHSLVSTAANVHDLRPSEQLLHGEEVRVRADAGYGGIEKRPRHHDRQMAWHIAIRAGQRRKLARDSLEHLMEQCKSSVRAKVEYVFFTVSRCLTTARAATELWRRRRIVWPCCWDLPIYCAHSPVGCEFYGIGVPGEAESGKNPTIGQDWGMLVAAF